MQRGAGISSKTWEEDSWPPDQCGGAQVTVVGAVADLQKLDVRNKTAHTGYLRSQRTSDQVIQYIALSLQSVEGDHDLGLLKKYGDGGVVCWADAVTLGGAQIGDRIKVVTKGKSPCVFSLDIVQKASATKTTGDSISHTDPLRSRSVVTANAPAAAPGHHPIDVSKGFMDNIVSNIDKGPAAADKPAAGGEVDDDEWD